MNHLQQCADKAIATFVRDTLGPPHWPNWAGLIPTGTTDGWGASKGDWRKQSKSITDPFQACAGVKVTFPTNEIDALGKMTLADLSDYLVEKAGLVTAQIAFKSAKAHLASLQANTKEWGAG